ncbi:MAG: phospholipid/cholesterol/gamma-HCH transport system permease protein [Frankiaceae bacterium]|jgi:phospholipid/cholesterol/gamma-HCH transport system permease protein|nr:phospholipid/cholesterol/gamma-HCH transport system permease protein [Frankiaceae bacterium]
MATVSPVLSRPARILGGIATRYVVDPLGDLGAQLAFYGRCLAWLPKTFVHYRKEWVRLLAEVSLGSGALVVGGGTVGVIFFLSFFTGTQVGLEGFKGLQLIGAEAFSGFVSAFGNTREITPLIAGITLAAQVGCGFTAQLGAMRISEEIDALEVMGIPSVPFLVTSRMIAALIAVVPLYLVSLFSSFFATRLIVVQLFGQSAGTYDYYFRKFLPPIDVFYSLGKAVIFAVVVTLIHCYYGYHARGGPEGVGVAVGKAIRTSIVCIVIINFFLSLAFWGATDTVRIAG